ncbi:MAG: hypothetical protein PVI41_06035 [Roseobacter sp.]
MPIGKTALVLTLCGLLAACGETLGEQALAGGAVGAGAAVVTDTNVVEGAAIGAGANVFYCQLYPERCN